MTCYHDTQYLDLVRTVLNEGIRKPNRTGIDTISVFGYQMKFDLRDSTIPLLTTKKMFTRGVIHEILWYLQGSDNIKYLNDNGVHIWDAWADKDGNLNKVYGYQWRKWPGKMITAPLSDIPPGTPWFPCNRGSDGTYQEHIDQIAQLINKLKNNPADRRMIVSAWNVADLPGMALPPCHFIFQCYARPLSFHERMYEAGHRYHPNEILENTAEQGVEAWMDEANIPKHELSLMLQMRSCDVGLGCPFNIVQYSILLRMLCEVANMTPGDFIWNGGDIHIYDNHIDALEEQLTRHPYPSPKFNFARKVNDIDDFKYDDFVISGYQSHPTIKMGVAV